MWRCCKTLETLVQWKLQSMTLYHKTDIIQFLTHCISQRYFEEQTIVDKGMRRPMQTLKNPLSCILNVKVIWNSLIVQVQKMIWHKNTFGNTTTSVLLVKPSKIKNLTFPTHILINYAVFDVPSSAPKKNPSFSQTRWASVVVHRQRMASHENYTNFLAAAQRQPYGIAICYLWPIPPLKKAVLGRMYRAIGKGLPYAASGYMVVVVVLPVQNMTARNTADRRLDVEGSGRRGWDGDTNLRMRRAGERLVGLEAGRKVWKCQLGGQVGEAEWEHVAWCSKVHRESKAHPIYMHYGLKMLSVRNAIHARRMCM